MTAFGEGNLIQVTRRIRSIFGKADYVVNFLWKHIVNCIMVFATNWNDVDGKMNTGMFGDNVRLLAQS